MQAAQDDLSLQEVRMNLDDNISRAQVNLTSVRFLADVLDEEANPTSEMDTPAGKADYSQFIVAGLSQRASQTLAILHETDAYLQKIARTLDVTLPHLSNRLDADGQASDAVHTR